MNVDEWQTTDHECEQSTSCLTARQHCITWQQRVVSVAMRMSGLISIEKWLIFKTRISGIVLEMESVESIRYCWNPAWHMFFQNKNRMMMTVNLCCCSCCSASWAGDDWITFRVMCLLWVDDLGETGQVEVIINSCSNMFWLFIYHSAWRGRIFIMACWIFMRLNGA